MKVGRVDHLVLVQFHQTVNLPSGFYRFLLPTTGHPLYEGFFDWIVNSAVLPPLRDPLFHVSLAVSHNVQAGNNQLVPFLIQVEGDHADAP